MPCQDLPEILGYKYINRECFLLTFQYEAMHLVYSWIDYILKKYGVMHDATKLLNEWYNQLKQYNHVILIIQWRLRPKQQNVCTTCS